MNIYEYKTCDALNALRVVLNKSTNVVYFSFTPQLTWLLVSASDPSNWPLLAKPRA
jgi:hypothetical protein